MKIHLFHLSPVGIVRAFSHIRAGLKICKQSGKRLWPFVPDSVNSMTAAWNFVRLLGDSGLPRPKAVIDVGANVSQMVKLLLAGCQPEPQILSFEPNPELLPIGRVFRIALSDTSGESDFVIPGDENWGRLAAVTGDVAKRSKRFSVRTARMDELIEQSKEIDWAGLPRPILLKVDTEGAEMKVLSGFGKYLADVDYLVIEVENHQADGENYDMLELFTFLATHGFNASAVLYACYAGPVAPTYLDMLFWKKPAPRPPADSTEAR